MSDPAAVQALTSTVLSFGESPGQILARQRAIHSHLLTRSRHVREPNFSAIHPQDLHLLFGAYDEQFFSGHCGRILGGNIRFRLAPRLTRAGGKTFVRRASSGETHFEIAIAISMLYDSFGAEDRRVSACGVECSTRLDALQRIFEHELIHLVEHLCWGTSSCASPRFQDIARRLFLHQARTHHLITVRERAAQAGIHVGSQVAFTFDGRRLNGRVSRVTKRASVLVEDPKGYLYSDGIRYQTYYVPIEWLELIPPEP